jgi:nicotinamide mononucleotide (NMN) deamidase PncC
VTGALLARGATVAVVEGCTAGAVSQLLLGAPGGPDLFAGAVVTTSTAAAAATLGLDPDLPGAELAERLAAAVRDRFRATVGLATVGAATAEADRPPGTLLVAVAAADSSVVKQLLYPIEPERFRVLAAHAALHRLLRWAKRAS